MEIVLIIVGIILLLVGLIGSIAPGLPGPPIAFVALLVLLFNEHALISMQENNYLWITTFGVITLFVTIVDYYMPIWGTKKFGGTKAGSRGSTIGLVIGFILALFIPGLGIIGLLGGPAVGAYIGEKSAGQDDKVAMKSAIGSFLGFIAGTFMKVVLVIAIAIHFTILLF